MTIITAASVPYEQVELGVRQALEDFKEHDLQLLEVTINERAITHQIACHLKKYFPRWHVDCEYNRREDEIKNQRHGNVIRKVIPDIIVHQRTIQNNLLIVEIKKKNVSTEWDKRKLKAFTRKTGKYNYCFGLLLLIIADNGFKILGELYVDGKYQKTVNFW